MPINGGPTAALAVGQVIFDPWNPLQKMYPYFHPQQGVPGLNVFPPHVTLTYQTGEKFSYHTLNNYRFYFVLIIRS